MGDQEMVDYLAHALQEPGGARPSIETLLHGFLPATAVIHTHADAVVSLTNNDRAADVLRGVYGKDVIALAYRRPGLPDLARGGATRSRRTRRRGRCCSSKHGTITLGRHRAGGVRGHDRADQPRRGGDRRARARAGARFGGAALACPAAGGAAARGARRWRPRLRGAARARPAPGARVFDDAPDVTRVRRPRAEAPRRLPDRARPRPTTRSTPSACRASCRSTTPAIRRRSRAAVETRGRALRRRLHRLLRGHNAARAPS